MADGMTLALTPAERSAVVHELRRYGNYRREIGDDLWDSAITPEHGEPDPPGITPKVEQMVDFHLAFAERCDSLAAAFESDEPAVSLDRSAIDVIGMALDEGYADEFPPELARTVMFCRLVSGRSNPSEQNLGTTDEAVVVRADPQPLATEKFAVALAQRMDEVNAALSAQLAELRQNQEVLTKRILAQQREFKQLREQNGNRRRSSPSPFVGLNAGGPSRRRHRSDPGRAL